LQVLKKNPADRFSTVQQVWVGETVVLIGGGPSLSQEQLDLIEIAHSRKRVRCIAVNNAFLRAPYADVCYFADSHWWRWNHEGLVHTGGQPPKPYECAGLTAEEVKERFQTFAGQKCSIQNSGANVTDESVHILRNKHFPQHGGGLSCEPGALVTGRHSGFQALNLAVLAGALMVLLIGYDGKSGADGMTHWFGSHPRPTPEANFVDQRRSFSRANIAIKACGVTVLNCTPGSAIETFPRASLSEALC
jgi:hypothetical protein